MKSYLTQHLNMSEHDLLKKAKTSLYDNLRDMMLKLVRVLDFSLDEDKSKNFEDLLDHARVDELEAQL